MALASVPEPHEPSQPAGGAENTSGGNRPPSGRPAPTGGGDDGGMAAALDVMKSLAAEELAQADRLSLKARQAFAFVAGFFGVVQVASVTALSKLNVHHQHAVLIVALVAAAFVAATATLAIGADTAKKFRNLGSQDVLDSVNNALTNNQSIVEDLLSLYATAVDERHAAVVVRKRWLNATQAVTAVAVLLLSGELILTLASRL